MDNHQFSTTDMAAVITLYRQVNELPVARAARIPSLLKGLMGLLTGHTAIWCEFEEGQPTAAWIMEGAAGHTRAVTAEELRNGAIGNDLRAGISQLQQATENVLVSPQGRALYWVHRQANKPCGRYVLIRRPPMDTPFTAREQLMVSMLQGTGLLEQSVAVEAVVMLTPRQWEVLKAMLAGDSEKKISEKLGLGQYTIHSHVREIYKRFLVSSRGQLMSKWIRRSAAKGTTNLQGLSNDDMVAI